MDDLVPTSAEILLDVLRENLSVDLDIDSEFYAYGGDSLIAVRVVSAARERGVPISLRDLMLHQTVRGMVGALRDAEGATRADRDPVAEPDTLNAFGLINEYERTRLPQGVVDAVPASALALGMLYQCEASEDPRLYRVMEGWEVDGTFDQVSFLAALAELGDRHPVLRSSFDFARLSVPVQLVWGDSELDLTVMSAGDSTTAGRLVDEWCNSQLSSRVDPVSDRLVRYCVVVQPESFRVVSSVHHAVIDGWSLSRLTVDLMALYRTAVEGGQSQLPPLPALAVQRAFIARERAAEASGEAADYWRQHAAGPRLWPSEPRAASVADASGYFALDLDPTLVSALRGVARILNTSLKSVFLAAHARALGTWAGHDDDVVTGVVFNTRPPVPGSDLAAGLFLNNMPVRFPTVGGTWASLVRAAADLERECSPFLAFPQARLVELLRRSAFDVLFNFVNFHAYRELGQPAALRARGVWHFSKPSFPFHVTAEVSDVRAQVRIGFDPAVVPGARVESFAENLNCALTAVAANPVSPTATLAGGQIDQFGRA